MWAALSMVFWNLAGCATSGGQFGNTVSHGSAVALEPTAESLIRFPEGSFFKIELKSGKTVSGQYVALVAGATALVLKVNQDAEYLALEFLEEDHLYEIPFDAMVHIALIPQEKNPEPNRTLIGFFLIVAAFVTAASLGAFQFGYN
jgi:hypothetical protein